MALVVYHPGSLHELAPGKISERFPPDSVRELSPTPPELGWACLLAVACQLGVEWGAADHAIERILAGSTWRVVGLGGIAVLHYLVRHGRWQDIGFAVDGLFDVVARDPFWDGRFEERTLRLFGAMMDAATASRFFVGAADEAKAMAEGWAAGRSDFLRGKGARLLELLKSGKNELCHACGRDHERPLPGLILVARDDFSPEDALRASADALVWATQNPLGGVLTGEISRWVCAIWRHAPNWAFRLRQPRYTLTQIEQAIRDADDTLQGASRVVLAAQEAVGMRFTLRLAELIERVRQGELVGPRGVLRMQT